MPAFRYWHYYGECCTIESPSVFYIILMHSGPDGSRTRVQEYYLN